ncbi:MAG: hypothetical protein KA715_14735 [Xanthomonadaceae bacterium]|nr:hypothetical protein [Xanthomonadaceae bacterium]
MKTGTIALLVQSCGPEAKPTVIETLSDDQEIQWVEQKMSCRELALIDELKKLRETRTTEEEQFGDYVEKLLSQPFVDPAISEQGMLWMHSKIKIEKFRKSETEAAKVIAEFAIRFFTENPECEDFYLMGPSAKVRVRIFKLDEQKQQRAA